MRIEVAIPCYNEESTIAKVITDFKATLPNADVVVYDNNSRDASAQRAIEAGARVVRVSRQGKGYVVQTMFLLSRADVLVIVDGDDSYEAQDVHLLIDPISDGSADMTIGTRLHTLSSEFRALHLIGNKVLTRTLNTIFHTSFHDILSGYRAFSRQFRELVPLISSGFEIETELMIQALEQGMNVQEQPIGFRNRPPGSHSKLNSFSDGSRIILTMIALLRDHRPLYTFSICGMVTAFVGGVIWLVGYYSSPGLPTPWRSVGALLIEFSVGLVLVGLILNTINTRLREAVSILRRIRTS